MKTNLKEKLLLMPEDTFNFFEIFAFKAPCAQVRLQLTAFEDRERRWPVFHSGFRNTVNSWKDF